MRVLVLPWLNSALPIPVKFFSIGAKTVFAEGFPDFRHELKIVGKIVDSVELRAQNLIGFLQVIQVRPSEVLAGVARAGGV